MRHTAIAPGVAFAFLVLAFAFGLSTASLEAQMRSAGTVEVRVGDARDESPIAKADVRLYVMGYGNFSFQAYADAGGRCAFYGVGGGSYVVRVQHVDYEVGESRIDVRPGLVSAVSVVLNRRQPAKNVAAPAGVVTSASLNVPAEARKELDAGAATLSTDPRESMIHLQNAVSIYPRYAQAYFLIALAQLKLSQREHARSAIEEAIRVDAKFSPARTLRGRLLLEEREFVKAEADLQESLRLDPSAWETHFELARCYFNTGKLQLALEHAQRALDLPQSDPLTHLLLADIYLKQDQRQQAMEELEAFLKANPSSPLVPKVQQKITQLRR